MHQQTLSLFCAAAPEDGSLLMRWERHLLTLTQSGVVTSWSEHHLQPGANRREELFAHLEQAACIILLLSADFFASEECLTLMKRACESQRERSVTVIPLLVRPVAWQNPLLAKLPYLPVNGVAITTWESPDEGWRQAVMGLQRLLDLPLYRTPSLVSARGTTNRERMLGLLRRMYQAAFFDSLQGMAWIELGMAGHPDAVENATHLLQQLPDRSERLLPAGTSVLWVYDQAEEQLLILGAPGSGKSTLLLDLARHLVARAETNETHPLPVIVPLSSWAVNRLPMTDWLIEQLARIYDVPRKLGRLWVEQGQVLPLLDGLDEMEEAARPQCIAAINTYHAERLAPLVVCSRRAEYDQASIRQRLSLQDAVVVQPLQQEHVTALLRAGGMELSALQEAFVERPSVRELAMTPLMLTVLLLAYRGVSISDLPRQEAMLEERVWIDYVERMVRQKGADRKAHTRIPEKRYPLAQTHSWLAFLAQQMQRHQQTIFYAEYLDAQWLAGPQQRTLTTLTRLLPSLVIGICVSLLMSLFITTINFDTVFLLQMGVLGGFVGGCLSSSHAGEAVEQRRHSRARISRHLRNAVLLGVLLAISYGLFLQSANPRVLYPDYLLSDWLRDEGILGLGSLLSGWAFQGCVDCQAWQRASLASIRHLPQGRLGTWMNMIRHLLHWQAAALLGIGIALSYGLSIGLRDGLRAGLHVGLSSGLSIGLSIGLSVILSVILVDLVLAASLRTLRFAERIHWTWHHMFQLDHLRTTVIVASIAFLLYGLGEGLSSGLRYGLDRGLSSGLHYGLSLGLSLGLSEGLSLGLAYWLLLGLYQGMQQEHLDDQNRFQFNQGIRRSLHNGLLVSLISAVIIGAMSVLSYGLRVGLRDGLNYGLDYGLRFGLDYGLNLGLSVLGLIILVAGLVVMWALAGGLTVLHHYVIRRLLARCQIFPFRAQAFLDDATSRILLRRVGGGYSFIHRRLQDYFADAPILPPQE